MRHIEPLRRFGAGVAAGLVRVQIFDRSMTLAAQAFTSLFPILILLGATLGAERVARFATVAGMPEPARHLIDDALPDRGLSTFGVLGVLVVLLSSTGLARALARAYASVWEVPRLPGGPRAAWRWMLSVLLVAALLLGNRLTAELPWPRLATGGLALVVDSVLAVALPLLLLHRAVPVRMLVPGGIVFGLVMLVVRPAGGIYLPRALETSYERYGTIGLAFTYIGWLYVVAFCLLLTTVLGRAVALALTGRRTSRTESPVPPRSDSSRSTGTSARGTAHPAGPDRPAR